MTVVAARLRLMLVEANLASKASLRPGVEIKMHKMGKGPTTEKEGEFDNDRLLSSITLTRTPLQFR